MKRVRLGAICAIAFGAEYFLNAATYFIWFAPTIGAQPLDLLRFIAANLESWLLFWSNGIVLSVVAIPTYLMLYDRFKAGQETYAKVLCGLAIASSFIYITGILIGLDTEPVLVRTLAAAPQAAVAVTLAHELFGSLQTLFIDQLAMPLQSVWAIMIGWEMVRRRDPIPHLGWLGIIGGVAGLIGSVGLSPAAFFLPGVWMWGKGVAYGLVYPIWLILTGLSILHSSAPRRAVVQLQAAR